MLGLRVPSLLLALLLSACAAPERNGLTVYGGRFFNSSLPNDIVQLQNFDPEDSFITAVAASQSFFVRENYRWEFEEQFVQHFGVQNHQEFNALVVLRWLRFPWHERMPTTFAVGDGLSYAAETPKLEAELEAGDGGTTKLLNYLMLELTFAAPSWEHWSIIGRIHHRSGILGLFSGVDGGSNILTLGLRYDF